MPTKKRPLDVVNQLTDAAKLRVFSGTPVSFTPFRHNDADALRNNNSNKYRDDKLPQFLDQVFLNCGPAMYSLCAEIVRPTWLRSWTKYDIQGLVLQLKRLYQEKPFCDLVTKEPSKEQALVAAAPVSSGASRLPGMECTVQSTPDIVRTTTVFDNEKLLSVTKTFLPPDAASLISSVLCRVPELAVHDMCSAVATHPKRFGPSLSLLKIELLKGNLSDKLYEALENSSFRKQEVKNRCIYLTGAATVRYARTEGGDFLLQLIVSRRYGDAISQVLGDPAASVKEHIGEFLFAGLVNSKFCGQLPTLHKFAVRVNTGVASLPDDSVVDIVLSFATGMILADEHWEQ
ncbi:hypothetical protein V2A60_002390 [Cordyceps javanica]